MTDAPPTRIEYVVGLAFAEGDTNDAYDELCRLSDAEPAKHELFAHLLLLAARLEWRHADQLRAAQRDRERRQRAAAKRKRRADD